MSDDNTGFDSELEEATNTPEEDAALEAEEDSDELLSETEEESDSDVLKRKEQREKTAKGKIEKAQKLLDDGKSLPPDLKWTLDHLKPPKGDEDLKSEANTKQTVKEILAEEKDEEVYQNKLGEWRSLPKAQRDLIKSKFSKLRSKGFLKGEALSELLSLVVENPEDKSRRRNAAALPDPSGVNSQDFSMDNFETLSPAKKLEALKNLVSIR